jgi:hypothetical protein
LVGAGQSTIRNQRPKIGTQDVSSAADQRSVADFNRCRQFSAGFFSAGFFSAGFFSAGFFSAGLDP